VQVAPPELRGVLRVQLWQLRHHVISLRGKSHIGSGFSKSVNVLKVVLLCTKCPSNSCCRVSENS
jgi:hypothetical protein